MFQIFVMGLCTGFAIVAATEKRWEGMWFQIGLVAINLLVYLTLVK